MPRLAKRSSTCSAWPSESGESAPLIGSTNIGSRPSSGAETGLVCSNTTRRLLGSSTCGCAIVTWPSATPSSIGK